MSNSKFNNLSEFERFGAVLDCVERERRGALPLNMDDPTTDGHTLKEAIETLGSAMVVMRSQAAPKSTSKFLKMINGCHSIRPLWIERETKDRKRQQFFKCDACGRKEKWCGFAIDVAGSGHCAENYGGSLEKMSSTFNQFHNNYTREFKRADKEKGLMPSDCGRFYTGETCLRKTLIQYMCSTFVQEIFYFINHAVENASEEELDTPDLVWATTKQAKIYNDLRDKLAKCIANENEGAPPLVIDKRFWNLVDLHRTMQARLQKSSVDNVLRELSKKTLSFHSDDEDPVYASPTNFDDEEEEEEEEEEKEEDQSMSQAIRGRRSKRVIGESDDDEAEEDQMSSKRAGKQPMRRGVRQRRAPDYLGRSASNAMDEEDGFEEEEEEDGFEEEEEEEDGFEDDKGENGNENENENENSPGPRVPQPNPASIAQSMRIPSEAGVPGPLGSRKNALLDLMEVQRLMTNLGNYVDAAKVTRAILTMQELMELTKR